MRSSRFIGRPKTIVGTIGKTGWLILMAIGIGLVFVLFSIKTRALEARTYVKKLEHKLEQEQAEVRMISAEIAHLESPERLRRLAEQHLDLHPVKAKQVLSLEGAAQKLQSKKAARAGQQTKRGGK